VTSAYSLAGTAFVELEASLLAQPGEGMRADIGDRRARRKLRDLHQRRMAGADEALRVDATHPGHDGRVVVGPATLDAGRVPGADVTMVDGVRVARGTLRSAQHALFES
jgi:hypothetical protein